MRHGEAIDNVREIISDKEIYWSVLTPDGEKVVNETIQGLPGKIDKIYVSPLPRTIQTASLVREKYKDVEYVIDDRIREINHGKYSGGKNNEDLDRTRERQVAGDYFVRFGEYGENKLDIELRLTNFLRDVFKYNFASNTIMIISHGSITSFMKRILKLKSPHIKTGKAEVFNDVNKSVVDEHYKKLEEVQKSESLKRLELVDKLGINETLKKQILKLCKNEINNIEFSEEVFRNYINGLSSNLLRKQTNTTFDDSVILVCFYNDFENIANFWMEHYINLGIKNFVMIDNNSKDKSTSIVESYNDKINLDLWSIKDIYNCYKMCGWRQQIIEYYGHSRKYLFVDADELFVYKNYKNNTICEFVDNNKNKNFKSLMIDVYSKNGIEDKNLDNYKYADMYTYKKSSNKYYGERFYGGFRNRIFGIRPSLQKISLLNYTGKEVLLNDHFCYPWIVNKNAKLNSFLIHYKFLDGDVEKYKKFAIDGRHWNNSREYKVYAEGIKENCIFYDSKYSKNLESIINSDLF